MSEIVSRHVLFEIEHHIRERVADAEFGFQFSEADEDAVTGALGQSLVTRPRQTYDLSTESQYEWSFTYRKIRGRGPKAPEKSIGADGIFHMEVFGADGELLRQKGLLFQAKMGTKPSGGMKMREQMECLIRFRRASILLEYGPHGYSATPVDDLPQDDNNWRYRRAVTRPLADVLGSDFVHCRIGQLGLRFDHNRECLLFPEETNGYHFASNADIVTLHIDRYPL